MISIKIQTINNEIWLLLTQHSLATQQTVTHVAVLIQMPIIATITTLLGTVVCQTIPPPSSAKIILVIMYFAHITQQRQDLCIRHIV